MSKKRKTKTGRDLTCILCGHFDLDTGYAGSDVTPGESMEFKCAKGMWFPESEFEDDKSCMIRPTREEFRSALLTAQTCREFIRYDGDPVDEMHIPIVGGCNHGKRMEFPSRPLPDLALVTHPFSFSDGSFERERYTLCYLLTEEVETRNIDNR